MKRIVMVMMEVGWMVAGAATITIDKVQQRYPWNGLVDIDYTLTLGGGETLSAANDRIEFTVTDNTTHTVYRPARFLQVPLPMSAGAHRVTWDANYDGVTFRSDNVTVTAAVNFYPEQYMEIDLSGGSSAECYPVTYRNGKPANGYTSDTYRKDVLVLRRIPAGSYMMGSGGLEWGSSSQGYREKLVPVAISKPFYIGIFPMTQRQYAQIMGTSPSESVYTHPMRGLSYNTIRGGSWPANSSVAANTVFDRLRRKCRAKDANGDWTVAIDTFDLPLEGQWEYACRAGTTTPYNDGIAIAGNASNAAVKEQIASICVLGGSAEMPVGSFLPNAWGIYDMHGNVYDMCRDRYIEDRASLRQYVDPVGPSTGSDFTRRGGNYDSGVDYGRSASRGSNPFGSSMNYNGFRVVCEAE